MTLINRYIRDEEMLWLFHHARSVVLPYIEATQSGVIPIAYKFGVPVIVSNVDGLTQFVEDEKTGFVCESEIDYLAALKKLENDNIRSAMSEAAIEYHLSNMDWKKNILSVLDAILNLKYQVAYEEEKNMIITKTPFRMSFFGGGTDMESFF